MRHFNTPKYCASYDTAVAIKSLRDGVRVLAKRLDDVINNQRSLSYAAIVYQMTGARSSAIDFKDFLDCESILIPANYSRRMEGLVQPEPEELTARLMSAHREIKAKPFFLFWDDYSSTGQSLKVTKDVISDWAKGGVIPPFVRNSYWLSAALGDEGGYTDWCVVPYTPAFLDSKSTLDNVLVTPKTGTRMKHFDPDRRDPKIRAASDNLAIMMRELSEDLMESPLVRGPIVVATAGDTDAAGMLVDELRHRHRASMYELGGTRRDLPASGTLVEFLFSAKRTDDFSVFAADPVIERIVASKRGNVVSACAIDRNLLEYSSDFAYKRNCE